jgi:FG-GAP repeat
MTTYTFNPKFGTVSFNWGDPTIWVGGVVPNDAAADVVLPTVINNSTGQPYQSNVSVTNNFAVHSVQVANNNLTLSASLSVADAVTLLPGTELIFGLSGTAGSLTTNSLTNGGMDIQGFGQITVTGSFLNQSTVRGTNLTITAGSFTNAGALTSSGNLTVNVAPGGFTNLSGGTLTGGTYTAGSVSNSGGAPPNSNMLYLNVGAAITSLGATVMLEQGGQVGSNGGAGYAPLGSTLTNITSAGTLSLQFQTYATNDLSVDGLLSLVGGTVFSSSHLTVDSSGHVVGTGTISGPVDVAGELLAGRNTYDIVDGSPNSLIINGAVAGTGTLKVAAAVSTTFGSLVTTLYRPATLELNGAASANVEFADTRGILKLDVPTAYTGAIKLAGFGSTVNLANIDLQSITSYSYSGDSSGGTLTLQRAGGPISLNFTGNFRTGGFALSAGFQQLSTSPPSLNITAMASPPPGYAPPTTDFNGDGINDVLLQNGQQLAEWQMGGSAAIGGGTIGALGAGWASAGTGDFNGDARSDLLLQNGQQLAEWQMNGNFVVGGGDIGPLGAGWTTAGTGDFNGDGRSDILLQNGQQLAEWQMNGTSVVGGGNIGTLAAGWAVAGTGDFNGDGFTDILLKNGQQLAEWQMNGTSVIGGGNIGTLAAGWAVAGTGDFNGDGRSDLLLQNVHQLAEWQMNGTSVIGSGTIGTLAAGWAVAKTGDFSGDGFSDILLQNGQQLAEWQMNGTSVTGGSGVVGALGSGWHSI